MMMVIRACLAGGGPHGILTLMAPDWSHLTAPSSWMMAAAQVNTVNLSSCVDREHPPGRLQSPARPGLRVRLLQLQQLPPQPGAGHRHHDDDDDDDDNDDDDNDDNDDDNDDDRCGTPPS